MSKIKTEMKRILKLLETRVPGRAWCKEHESDTKNRINFYWILKE
jgi:hypothetical protein